MGVIPVKKFFSRDRIRVRGVGVSGVSIEMTPDPRPDGENYALSHSTMETGENKMLGGR